MAVFHCLLATARAGSVSVWRAIVASGGAGVRAQPCLYAELIGDDMLLDEEIDHRAEAVALGGAGPCAVAVKETPLLEPDERRAKDFFSELVSISCEFLTLWKCEAELVVTEEVTVEARDEDLVMVEYPRHGSWKGARVFHPDAQFVRLAGASSTVVQCADRSEAPALEKRPFLREVGQAREDRAFTCESGAGELVPLWCGSHSA